MMLPHPMYSTALADAGQTSRKAGINELEIEVFQQTRQSSAL